MPVKLRWTLRSDPEHDGDGKCRTATAGSPRAALKNYLTENPDAPGRVWWVKQYGVPEDWEVMRRPRGY